MSGLKRMMTANRRRAPQDDVPTAKEEEKSAPLLRRFTTRRDVPTSQTAFPRAATAALPSSSLPAKQKLDISAALAVERVKPVVNSASTNSSSTPRTPHRQGSLGLPTPFQLCRLSVPYRIELAKLLAKSDLSDHTLRKADAKRYSVAQAMDNARDLDVVDRVLQAYVPYALTCWQVSQRLNAPGANVIDGIVWLSGLNDETLVTTKYEGGLSLEVAMVLMGSAVIMIRQVVETDAEFAMQQETTLIDQIKSLQAAAGIFAYVRDTVAPSAIADFSGVPPPEIVPDTSAMFYALALAMAQALRVRRAILNGMSEALLAKLSVGAYDLTREAIAKHQLLVEARIQVCPQVRMCADQLQLLCKGWIFEYIGFTTPTETQAGVKAGAFRAAREFMEKASKSPVFGKVAALDLDNISREYEDTARANDIVYQHAVPTPDEILLPPGRILANATLYQPPQIPQKESSA